MSNLGEKMRKAREQVVEVGGHHFTIRRPTDAQRAEWFSRDGISPLEMVRRCVIGWDLTELDLYAGGSPALAEFSTEVFAEYVNDMPELWGILSEAIQTAIQTRLDALETAKKN
ncbi:MAG: hypothetical protein WBC07_08545 [Methylotenera sp.]